MSQQTLFEYLERRTYEVRQLSNEINFLLAVLAILQPANIDTLWPWSFLHRHLQWHGFAMPQCGVGAWSVRTCLWTLSWKWKHGTSCSGMYAIFCVLNSVTVPPQHMENFSKPLEIMQYQEHKPFAGTKYFLKVEPLLKMSTQQTTISKTERWKHCTGKRTCSIWSNNSQNDCWWNEHELGNCSFDTDWRFGDEKYLFVPRGCPLISQNNSRKND